MLENKKPFEGIWFASFFAVCQAFRVFEHSCCHRHTKRGRLAA